MLLSEKMRYESNLATILGLLKRKNLAEPEGLRNFIQKHLWDVEFPAVVGVDSAYQRGKKIIKENPQAKLFGSVDDEIFAVRYPWYEEEHLTIYLPGIDYKTDFAEVMQNQLEIKSELAKRISDTLSHDEYYLARRNNVFTDPLIYSANVIRAFNPEIGTYVYDSLNQKEILVFAYNGKRYINFDIESPAVFIEDRVLYIYEPDSTKSNC